MMGKLKSLLRKSPTPHNRRLLQPMVVAMVVMLFSLLFFGMAMMDLRRLEGLLMDALKKKALYVIEVIEKSSYDKYRRLMKDSVEYQSFYTGLAIDEEAFLFQESLTRALIEVARYVDLQEEAEGMTRGALENLASAENLQAVMILDEAGHVVSQSNAVPSDLLSHAKTLVEGREDVAIHLFHGLGREDPACFIGLRKQDGKGAIALIVNRKGLEYWGYRVATQAAIEELQWGSGVIYLAVEDLRGRTLARAGSIPEEKMEQCLLVAGAVRDPKNPAGKCVKVGDMKFLELSSPFQLNGETIGTVRVGLETHETERLLVENRWHILLWTGIMVLIGLFAMGFLYQTQNRHVAKIQAMQERLHQAEKLSALGKLGAGVAHEIRNPLNAISMAVQSLQREFSPTGDAKTAFDHITHIVRDEIKRLNGIIEDFLSLSRSDRLDLRLQPAADLLERVVFLAREETRGNGVRVEKRWKEPLPHILIDLGKMEQALLNIVRNAMQSIAGEGSVTISCEPLRRNVTRITIADDGAGIPMGAEKRIFEPFYTTKENGVGLGLAIAREIIVAHGGEIRVESGQSVGTAFEILLSNPMDDR